MNISKDILAISNSLSHLLSLTDKINAVGIAKEKLDKGEISEGEFQRQIKVLNER